MANLPKDLNAVVERALQLSRAVPGFLGDNEARFLGTLAACAPAEGTIVEIGSYKGKSTVLLAFVAAHYGLGPVVAIDPHTSPSITDPKIAPGGSSFEEFVGALRSAKLEEQVEVHRAFSREVAKDGTGPYGCCGSTAIILTGERKKISRCSRSILRTERSWRCTACVRRADSGIRGTSFAFRPIWTGGVCAIGGLGAIPAGRWKQVSGRTRRAGAAGRTARALSRGFAATARVDENTL